MLSSIVQLKKAYWVASNCHLPPAALVMSPGPMSFQQPPLRKELAHNRGRNSQDLKLGGIFFLLLLLWQLGSDGKALCLSAGPAGCRADPQWPLPPPTLGQHLLIPSQGAEVLNCVASHGSEHPACPAPLTQGAAGLPKTDL